MIRESLPHCITLTHRLASFHAQLYESPNFLGLDQHVPPLRALPLTYSVLRSPSPPASDVFLPSDCCTVPRVPALHQRDDCA